MKRTILYSRQNWKEAYKLRTLDGKVLEASHNVKHIKEYYVKEG